jgi:hypothetical protein
MAQGHCNNHGKIEAVWKEGTAKSSGKAYAFWGCPVGGKDAQGNWIKCKVEVANTASGKFEQDLDKSATQMDGNKKDATITRIAIAKSLIESGHKYNHETLIEAQAWEAWVNGRLAKVELAAPLPAEPTLEDIPF